MALTLPTGLVLAPILNSDVLSGGRTTSYRFDVLSKKEDLLGRLEGVSGGGLEWHAFASVKGAGTLNVTDLNGDLDWLNIRIRPQVTIERIGGSAVNTVTLGVFLCAAPVEAWTSTGRGWTVEIADKCSILDQDVVTDANGVPITYTASIGVNVIETVRTLITGTGETAQAILPGAKTLPKALVWDVGTTRLTIVNELLNAAGYFSLWCDGEGQFRVSEFVPAQERVPVYSSLTPFSKGDLSLMSPDWSRDRDIYAIPNRYVAIGQGSGDTAALVGVATNEDPASPFSKQARGRWITRVVTGVEAVSQEDLNTRAKMGLAGATSVSNGIAVQHVFLPDLLVNSVVRFVNPDAGLDILMSVTVTKVPFDPVALCSSDLREVLA